MDFKETIKRLFIGEKRDPHDTESFHKVTLIAFFAWVGLGSDGLSSSCYGPSEVMFALGGHSYLGLFIALATVITIFIISTSYSQIIELFPSGGGGYLVASKLLSPNVGMISGSALLIDYVLTITVSISSGADALFSFIPPIYLNYKLPFALFMLVILTIMNLRGVKESVLPLIPIFLTFVLTHLFIILYGIFMNLDNLTPVVQKSAVEFNQSVTQIGLLGTFLIMVHAYSMGAGTYTGIEAVSNGLPILREPRVHTAKRTMKYMAFSLSITVLGLLLSYLLYDAKFQHGKTLNAVLFQNATLSWSPALSHAFIIITLLSEGAILFVAAQTGFIDGPRVLSNMALDRWVPTRFAALSDRLVTQNGVFLMGGAAFILMLATKGSVIFLLVLYSINVFITFALSQLGMVRHWWKVRETEKKWIKKIIINGIGLILTFSILLSVIIVKFFEGGWITLIITGGLISILVIIKRHYNKTAETLRDLDRKLKDLDLSVMSQEEDSMKKPAYNPLAKTAVLLVNGFSGIGLHSLLSIFRLFGNTFRNFVFIEVGLIDAGVFKGAADIENLNAKINNDVNRYVEFMNKHGFFAEGYTSSGLDIVQEVLSHVPAIHKRYPNSVFFGGQLVFTKDTFFTRLLHNHTVFQVQRELYHQGIQFVILPIKIT